MNKKDLWNLFKQTGKVEYYLKYKEMGGKQVIVMIKKVEGIIIKETSYKETSKIVNIFTDEYGIIGVVRWYGRAY